MTGSGGRGGRAAVAELRARHQRVAGRSFAAAVEVEPAPRFALVHLTSRPVGATRYDLAPARDLLGYEPRDRWPEGIDWPAGARPPAGSSP